MSEVEDKEVAAAKLAEENKRLAFELTLQRRWKEDIQNAYRAQLSDILSHVSDLIKTEVEKRVGDALGEVRNSLDEARSSAVKTQNEVRSSATKSHNDIVETFNKHLNSVPEEFENRVSSIVIKLLKERQVTDDDGNLNHHAVAYAISRINK